MSGQLFQVEINPYEHLYKLPLWMKSPAQVEQERKQELVERHTLLKGLLGRVGYDSIRAGT
jgi:hypothetical protein